MHSIVFAFLLASYALAGPAKLKDISFFYADSQRLFKVASSEKSEVKAHRHLKELKKSFEQELAIYKKQNPKEGSDQEQAVATFYYTFDPAFELLEKKKLEPEDCERASVSVRAGDSMGRAEGSPPSREAHEVLEWIKTLCK